MNSFQLQNGVLVQEDISGMKIILMNLSGLQMQ